MSQPVHYAPLVWLAVAIVALVILIARCKVHAFIALFLAALFIGICSGMPLGQIAKGFQEGVGAMLGNIAIVVGLGAVLGKLLEVSGGAHVVATTLIQLLGQPRLPWTMLLIGFVIGLPIFFTVGVVLLTPILFTVVRETRANLLSLAIPLLAGLSAAHGLVPPHPGPMAAISVLKADPGKTILLSILVGFPAAIIAGPIFARWIVPRVPAGLPVTASNVDGIAPRIPAHVGLAFLTLLLPVLLMLLTTLTTLFLPTESKAAGVFEFLGNPAVAMALTVLLAFYTFGKRCGYSAAEVLRFTESSLTPIAAILLLVGAGGGFNKVLVLAGVADSMAALARYFDFNPLFLAWLLAVLIRISTGSATVAITTTAGIVAPILAEHPAVSKELAVVAMGSGSLILSHLNDGGFWFVKEYLGLSVSQTLKTWTILETIISFTGLILSLLLSWVF